MKVTLKKMGADKVRLDCVATPAEVNSALHTAQLGFAQNMGLRPEEGKTVAQVAHEKMGIKNLDSIVEAEAMSMLAPFALDKKNIVPLAQPSPEPKEALKRDREFAFSLTVLLKPAYELTSYEPVEITLPAYVFDESLVQAELDKMAQNYTTYVKGEDKALESGDACLLAIEAFENGERNNALSTEGRTYVTGQGYMPEGFDSQVIGMKPGETKSFTFEGPGFDDDFNPITTTVDCTVTIKEIQVAVKPEITDEWIKTNMPWYPSAEVLREDLRRNIERSYRAEYDNYARGVAVAELAKRFSRENKIADEAYEATRNVLVENLRRNVQQQGMQWEQFLEQNGGEQQFGMMLMLQTRETLVQGFALDALYRHAKLKIDDADIDAACQAINPQANPKQIRKQFEDMGQSFALRESAERLKANKFLLDNAKITYAEAPEQQA